MEDGQDRREDAETNAGFAAMSATEPAGASDAPAGDTVAQDAPVTGSDEASLTGAIAAIGAIDDLATGEAEQAEAPAAAENLAAAVEPEPAAEPAAQPQPQATVQPQVASEPAAAPAPEAPEAAVATTPAAPAPAATAEVAPAYAPAADIDLVEARGGVPIWPYLLYFGLWVVFCGLLAWQFSQTPAGTPLYELTIYGPSILAGLVLTALGPILALGVWIMLWFSRPGARAGLFSRSLLLGAVVTLAGVALWLVALGAVDMYRLGRLI